MNGQEQALLEILLAQREYLSYDALADRLNVSSRTVMRLMKETGAFLKDFSVSIEVKRRSGIKLLGSEESLKGLSEALNLQKTNVYTSLDRQTIIMIELFLAEEPVKSYYLAYLLNVSVGTINRDLEEIGVRLKKNGLELVSQRGSGWQIRGSLYGARQAMTRFFRRYVDITGWSTQKQGVDLKMQLSGGARKKLKEFLDIQGLYRTFMLISTFDYTIGENFVQEDYQRYLLYTHVTLHYPNLTFRFVRDHRNQELESHVLYPRMCEFSKKVKKEEGITLAQEDICDLLAVYLSMRNKESLCKVYKYDEEVHLMTLELLEDIEAELHRNLMTDKQLVERLDAHLNLMFDRLHLGLVAENTDLDQLQQEYPQIFRLVSEKVAVFAKRNQIDIGEEETGYIIIHILASIVEQEEEKQKIRVAVLCMSGIGTSRMLEGQLRTRFPRMEIVTVCSLTDFREEELVKQEVDLVLSTIKTELLTLPVFFINPLPGEAEFLKLEQLCSQIAQQRLKDSFSRRPKEREESGAFHAEEAMEKLVYMEKILESFSCERIRVDTVEQLYQEVSVKMCPDVKTQEAFVELLKERSRMGNLVIPERGILFLHGRLANMLGLKVFLVEHGIDEITDSKWHQVKHVIAMAAPREAGEGLLRLFSCISAGLIQEPELAEAIERHRETEIFQVLGKMLSMEIFQ